MTSDSQSCELDVEKDHPHLIHRLVGFRTHRLLQNSRIASPMAPACTQGRSEAVRHSNVPPNLANNCKISHTIGEKGTNSAL